VFRLDLTPLLIDFLSSSLKTWLWLLAPAAVFARTGRVRSYLFIYFAANNLVKEIKLNLIFKR